MRVCKITAKDGKVFYTQSLPAGTDRWLDALEGQAEKRHGGVSSVEIVGMTEAEYQSIPVTNDSASLFDISRQDDYR